MTLATASLSVVTKPTTNNATSLDDQGFVGGSDVIEFSVTSSEPGFNSLELRRELQRRGLIPYEGFSHPSSGLATVRSVTLNQSSPIYYEGALNYNATRRPQDDINEDQNPWDLPAKFSFASVTSDLPIDSDYDGEAIVNPGTDEPVEGVTAPISDFAITIVKNFQAITPVLIADFSNKLNSDAFLGFPPGVLRTGDITAEPQSHEGVTYYVVTVPIVARAIYGGVIPERAWWHRRVLKGFYEVQTIDGADKVVRALDDEGQPTTERVLLTADGRRLPKGDPPVYDETRRHGTRAFISMGLL